MLNFHQIPSHIVTHKIIYYCSEFDIIQLYHTSSKIRNYFNQSTELWKHLIWCHFFAPYFTKEYNLYIGSLDNNDHAEMFRLMYFVALRKEKEQQFNTIIENKERNVSTPLLKIIIFGYRNINRDRIVSLLGNDADLSLEYDPSFPEPYQRRIQLSMKNNLPFKSKSRQQYNLCLIACEVDEGNTEYNAIYMEQFKRADILIFQYDYLDVESVEYCDRLLQDYDRHVKSLQENSAHQHNNSKVILLENKLNIGSNLNNTNVHDENNSNHDDASKIQQVVEENVNQLYKKYSSIIKNHFEISPQNVSAIEDLFKKIIFSHFSSSFNWTSIQKEALSIYENQDRKRCYIM